jgi:hypothetical protein
MDSSGALGRSSHSKRDENLFSRDNIYLVLVVYSSLIYLKAAFHVAKAIETNICCGAL